MDRYYQGQGVIAHAEFYDSSGALVAPATVTIYIRKPDGTTSNSTSFSNPSVGVYEHTILTAPGPPGEWRWRIESTGPVGADETSFMVLRSQAT